METRKVPELKDMFGRFYTVSSGPMHDHNVIRYISKEPGFK